MGIGSQGHVEDARQLEVRRADSTGVDLRSAPWVTVRRRYDAASATELHIDGYPNRRRRVAATTRSGTRSRARHRRRRPRNGVDPGTISLVVQLRRRARPPTRLSGALAVTRSIRRAAPHRRRRATDEYDYTSTLDEGIDDESDYRALLTGHGYGDASPSHRERLVSDRSGTPTTRSSRSRARQRPRSK